MYVFIEWWALKADIILLGVVYFVTTSRVEQMGLSRGKSYPALRLVHGAVGAILFVTFLVSMYFFVRFLVLDALLSEADFYRSTYAKLDAAFYILYFIAAIEVLTWATIIFVRSHNAHIRSKIGLYLLTLVATPLLVRSSIAVGLTLKYKLLASQPAPAPRSVALVEVLFRDIAVVVIFAGILLIGLQKGWSPAHYGVETLDVPTEGKAPRLQVNTTREVSSMTVKEYPSSTPLWVNTQWAQQSNPAQLQWADHHKRRG
ncbi:MAG: hypothetical protein M1833_000972 [Piccolia ochrophora]|nr:MAG: hypothetical protein M1833_000972 [Piccolia ochrophora]